MDRKPTLLSRLAWRVLLGLYDWKGFTLEGRPPDTPKFVLVGAPHTTNWDFVFFAGAVRQMGVRPSFIGKNSLFKWPMTRFMYDMGGMPVDRSKAGGYTSRVVEAIERADRMTLVIAPEGSRSSDGRWRSGFYHIAHGAGVPIVPAWFDYKARRGGLGEPIMPSGDFHADLAKIAAFLQSKRPGYPRYEVLMAQAHGDVSTPPVRKD